MSAQIMKFGPKAKPGFVYIFENAAMVGLCKVGMTTRTPEERAAELHDTGSPVPYTVAHRWPVDDVHASERCAHQMLDAWRVGDDREWFRLPAGLAAEMLDPLLNYQPPTNEAAANGTTQPKPTRRRFHRIRTGVECFGWFSLAMFALALTQS